MVPSDEQQALRRVKDAEQKATVEGLRNTACALAYFLTNVKGCERVHKRVEAALGHLDAAIDLCDAERRA